MIKTAAKVATIGLAAIGGTTGIVVVAGIVAGTIIYKKVMGTVGDLFEECLQHDIENGAFGEKQEDVIDQFEWDYE